VQRVDSIWQIVGLEKGLVQSCRGEVGSDQAAQCAGKNLGGLRLAELDSRPVLLGFHMDLRMVLQQKAVEMLPQEEEWDKHFCQHSEVVAIHAQQLGQEDTLEC
jgi:hypothetical protein